MAEQTMIPLDVLLALGFGLALGALVVFLWGGGGGSVLAAPQGLVVQRDPYGRIVGIQGAM